MDLGQGKARDFYGTAIPHLPWCCVSYKAPDGGIHLQLRVPGPKQEALLREHPWWNQFLPTATFLGPKHPQAA